MDIGKYHEFGVGKSLISSHYPYTSSRSRSHNYRVGSGWEGESYEFL